HVWPKAAWATNSNKRRHKKIRVIRVLKHQPQPKLNLPRIGARGETTDTPDVVRERRCIRIERQVCVRGRVPVLNVEDVESLHSELQLPVFPNRKTLEQRKVGVENRLATEYVAAQTAK